MARRNRSLTPTMTPVNSTGLKRYPSVLIEKLTPPPHGPAIEFRAAQIALWHRVRRSVRTLTVAVVSVAVEVTLALLGGSHGFVDFLIVVLSMVALIALILGLAGLNRTRWLYRKLHRSEWTEYRFEQFRMAEGRPIRMVLVDPKTRTKLPVQFSRTKGAELLRGMIHDEVWFAGDPTGPGILTVAGGGEMFRTRPNPPAKVKPRKAPKPRKVKALSPEKQRREAARAAVRRAKLQERYQKIEAKRKAKPPKPVRQPRLPRVRGAQKIKWQ